MLRTSNLRLKYRALSVLLGVLLLAGCAKNEPEPAWIVIDELAVQAQAGLGTSQHQLTEVYAYSPTRLLGIFPVPGRIPVLEFGSVQIDLFPGIRANGIKASPDIYPFLSRYRTTLDLAPGSFDTIQPVFVYDDLSQLKLHETCDGSISFLKELQTGYPLTIDTLDVFEGTGSATFRVDETNTVFEVASIPLDLPQNGTPIYLEMHYKNEIPFLIGLEGRDAVISGAKDYVVGLNPRESWNKVYISLTDAVNLSELEEYKLLIRTDLPFDGSVTEGRVWIDNLKLFTL